MMRIKKPLATLAVILLIRLAAHANVRMPLLFSDHMVLQRDMAVPVLGWADAGEEITVTFGNDRQTTKADAQGRWCVHLGKMAANATPQKLTIDGKNTIVFEDVLVGDVWVCAGQSNMELYLGQTYNASNDVPAANDSQLRLFRVFGPTSIKPEEDVQLWNKKKWQPCSPEAAETFSAVGYYFGREIRKDLHIPIALIYSVQGGSYAQLWISLDAIQKNCDADPEFKIWLTNREAVVDSYPQRQAAYQEAKQKYEQELELWKVSQHPESNAAAPHELQTSEPILPKEPRELGPYNSFMVGNLYNTRIAPLTQFAIKGVLWYQGEANDKNSRQYRILFPILIKDWRQKWEQGDFPFLFVQLPNIHKAPTEPVPPTDLWPGLREAQASALSLPNTGMAVTIDVGDPNNVHGQDKLDVGYRLSLVARHLVYGENIVSGGPVYSSNKIKSNTVWIKFASMGSGLKIGTPPWTPLVKIPSPANELQGFAIAGVDKKWHWAKARIDGNKVAVWSTDVVNPVAVRYGWADNPPCNLYNRENLPAAPFRTDDWDQ